MGRLWITAVAAVWVAGCGGDFGPRQARFTVEPCESASVDVERLGPPLFHGVPVLERGGDGAWDAADVLNPSVARFGDRYVNLYSGFNGAVWRTGVAFSEDGVSWEKALENPVLAPEMRWEGDYIAANGSALAVGDELLYWYHSGPRNEARIGLARSKDALRWEKHPEPVFDVGAAGSWDESAVADPYVVRCGASFTMYYLGQNRFGVQRLGAARSADGVHWQRSHLNPILDTGGSGQFDERGLGEPAVFFSEGNFWMLYTGRDAHEGRRLGWAVSGDGVEWRKRPDLGVIGGESGWDVNVVCDPTLEVQDGRLRMWYGGGDVDSPDENLNGMVGLAVFE